MKKKRGFTLVELLAVIVILAIILVIAVPKVMSVIEDAKMGTLESTAKMIASQAEKQKVQNTVLGNDAAITCEGITNINKEDYPSCEITFEDNTAKVTIVGGGKFDGLWVCNGTKTNATATKEECTTSGGSVVTGASFIEGLFANEEILHNGLIKDDTADENIRYAGSTANVKNKVYFNCDPTDGTNEYGSENYNYESSCEIWRIIGVFDIKEAENDNVGSSRIKIVRNEDLGSSIEWNTYENGCRVNQWGETTFTSDNTTIYPGSYIKQYLNDGEESYYNSLTSIAKGQISDALWYTGATGDGTASEVYENERSNTISTDTTVNYTTTWVGKIGLIYISDFGYAGTNCVDKTIKNYDESCDLSTNWLVESYSSYWTITPSAYYGDEEWFVSGFGAQEIYVESPPAARPSVYLSSNVQIIGGNGDTEPYILK